MTAISAFTVWAIANGGQALRTWLLGALLWMMALPLFGQSGSRLLAMMIFEPFRGTAATGPVSRGGLCATDPIHVLSPMVVLLAVVWCSNPGLKLSRKTPLPDCSLLGLIYVVQILNPLQGGLVIGLRVRVHAGALAWFYFGQEVKLNFMTGLCD